MSRLFIFCAFLLSFAFYGNAAPSQLGARAPSKDEDKVAGKGSSWWQPEDTSLKADKNADTNNEGDQDDSDDSDSGGEEDDTTDTDEESDDDNGN